MDLLRLRFSGAGENASIRSRTAELLAGQPTEVVQDVLLVVTELVANVVQHTGDGGELHLACHDGRVRIAVHDQSRSFPQLQRPDPRRPGGRGLMLVAAVAETWGSRPTPTGKVVWAHISMPDPLFVGESPG
jgi:anti-sigma regulatory factor (Ser/Thr protein kinase)